MAYLRFGSGIFGKRGWDCIGNATGQAVVFRERRGLHSKGVFEEKTTR